MANNLPAERRLEVLKCLVKGSGIRQTEEKTGVHRDTIGRFAFAVGVGCMRLHDALARDLNCPFVDMDEQHSTERARLCAERDKIDEQIDATDKNIATLRNRFEEFVGDAPPAPARAHRPRQANYGSAVARIMAIFDAAPDAILDSDDVAAKLNEQGTPIDVATIRSTLIRLLRDGRLNRPGRGKYRASAKEPLATCHPAGLNGTAYHAEEAVS